MKLSTNRRTTSYSNSLGRLVVTLTKKTMTETERALGLAFMGLQMAWYLLGNSLEKSVFTGWSMWSDSCVGLTLICDVPLSYQVVQPVLPISHLPKQNQAK